MMSFGISSLSAIARMLDLLRLSLDERRTDQILYESRQGQMLPCGKLLRRPQKLLVDIANLQGAGFGLGFHNGRGAASKGERSVSLSDPMRKGTSTGGPSHSQSTSHF